MSIPAGLKPADELSVLHATDKVINLMTKDGMLISLVTQPLGNGPHNIVLPLKRFERVPSFGEKALLDNNKVKLESLDVELENAALWSPIPEWPKVRKHGERIKKAVPDIVAALHSDTPDQGVLLLLEKDQKKPDVLSGHFAQAMLEPAEILIAGLKGMDFENTAVGVQRLAGLGTGLTPAGDDFLSGAMLACWSGFCDQEMLVRLPGLASQAAQRTTRLSTAYLQSAAEGEFGAVWHALLEAIAGEDNEEFRHVLNLILGIGHNSGAYTLAGFVKLVDAYAGNMQR